MTTSDFSKKDFKLSFKVFYELMAKRVQEVLLISSPYDAFIMEEDEGLAVKIIEEYRGLNLTRPPRFTWVNTANEALKVLSQKKIELILTMPRIDDTDPFVLGRKIKKEYKNIPIFLLAHDISKILLHSVYENKDFIDKIFVWSGSNFLLMTIIKSVEDMMNVEFDTRRAMVKTIIIVEDSPEYYSFLLPLLYQEIISQTRKVMEDSLNKEHRFLRMRARPKILLAQNYEEAEELYEKYKEYLLCVISDVRFRKNGKIDPKAGITFLSKIREENPDIPILMLSSEAENMKYAKNINAVFLNKLSVYLHTEIISFLKEYLGFGDFIFKMPNGKEICRVKNLAEMEKALPYIDLESIKYHSENNDFSVWMTARSEIELVSKLRPRKVSEFPDLESVRSFIMQCLKEARINRQKGIVVEFDREGFDPDADFIKLGKGSLGGKARGLAFFSNQIHRHLDIENKFENVTVSIPKTMVISTEEFDSFVEKNDLKKFSDKDAPDEEIAKKFLNASFSEEIEKNLKEILYYIKFPLAVRSSSLLEDSQYQPYAGIYNTYMIPNAADIETRFKRLTDAIKLVYASTYFAAPKAFAKNTLHKTKEEKMAVIIQQIIGRNYDGFFYPAISGVCQSYNFYPISPMAPEDGVINIAAGLGKIVVEGSSSISFSPKLPRALPNFSTVKDMLMSCQKFFYALDLQKFPAEFGSLTDMHKNLKDDVTLTKINIEDFENISFISPIRQLCSTYYPEDDIIRDGINTEGFPIMTFASILKYNSFPLSDILKEILEIGYKGMGCNIEIEFAVNYPKKRNEKYEFSILQIRPMAKAWHESDVAIKDKEKTDALCFSASALGNNISNDIYDIIFVDPERLDISQTLNIASEINRVNKLLQKEGRKYLLIGPGRWGTADRWLGIPVTWNDISNVGVIIEVSNQQFKAEPSQGSHFFHNITSLGISYLTIDDKGFINWDKLKSLPIASKSNFITHVRLKNNLTIKIDGKKSQGVVLL